MIDPLLMEEAPAVTRRTLRQFTALAVVALGGLALWQGGGAGRQPFAIVFATAAVLLGALGWWLPEKIRPIYAALVALASPIGRVTSIVLLAIVFYGVVMPLGLLFALVGRDVLQVRRPVRMSHWTPKATTDDVRDYLSQA